jgi:hypothetical protein
MGPWADLDLAFGKARKGLASLNKEASVYLKNPGEQTKRHCTSKITASKYRFFEYVLSMSICEKRAG